MQESGIETRPLENLSAAVSGASASGKTSVFLLDKLSRTSLLLCVQLHTSEQCRYFTQLFSCTFINS